METFYTEDNLKDFYQDLVKTYNTQKDRLMPKIREKFRYQYEDKLTPIKNGYYMNIYKLKVSLETQLMRDVNCNYKYILTATPNSVGCDIRELIFNVEKETNKISLLDNIKRASQYLLKNILNNKINHIMTDLDDTLYPSKSIFSETAGRDSSWKNREPYPGIIKFYELFYNSLNHEESRYSTVLTGSPLFLKETLLDDPKICSILGPNYGFIQGSERKRDAIQTLLKGMSDRPFYYLAPSAQIVGQEKYRRFKQYSQIFPEYRLIFIGDNGQGDLIAGKMMLQDQADCLVCIHNIFYKDKFLFSDAEEKQHAHSRLFFFKNYLELAYIFTHKLNIFTRAQYNDFKEATIMDIQTGLEKISKPSKNLYQHYVCCDNVNTCISPNSCIKALDLSIKRVTQKRKYNGRCKTRKQ